LTIPQANGNGDPIDVSRLADMAIQISGTFSLTLQLQGTIDGTNYVNVGSTISAAGITAISGVYRKIRPVVSSYVSGEMVAVIVGRKQFK